MAGSTKPLKAWRTSFVFSFERIFQKNPVFPDPAPAKSTPFQRQGPDEAKLKHKPRRMQG
jgi:hypothetical protein